MTKPVTFSRKFSISCISCILIASGLLSFGQAKQNKELKDVLNSQKSKQQIQVDSIKKAIASTRNDTLRFDLYLRLFDLSEDREQIKTFAPGIILKIDSLTKHISPKSRMYNALLKRKGLTKRFISFGLEHNQKTVQERFRNLDESISIFKSINDVPEVTESYIQKADDYQSQGLLFKQFQTLQDGLSYAREKKFDKSVMRFYTQLQRFYGEIGDTSQVLQYLDNALQLYKIIGDSTKEARHFLLAGASYSKVGKHKQAIQCFLKSIESYKKKHMALQERRFQAYLLLAEEYRTVGDYDHSIAVYEELNDIGRKEGRIQIMAIATVGKGKALSLKGEHQAAIKTHIDLARLAEAEGEKGFAAGCYIELAQDYFRLGDYSKAKKYMDYVLELINIREEPPTDQYDWEEIAFRIDSAAKSYEGAFRHYYRMNVLKTELKKETIGKTLEKNKFDADLISFKAKQEKENALNAEEKKRQRYILYGVLIFLLLALILVVYIFYNLRKTRKANKIIAEQKTEVLRQKHLVEEKQREIVDSISYAKRIQEAILPPKDLVNKKIPDNFILYRPKDIVAGDFYWMQDLDQSIYIAAADSTGHGVPGAMVSVVCSNALNRAVKEFGLRNTGEILDKTRELVIETFEKSGEEVKDGMDISLIRIQKKSGGKTEIQWSGAYNSLWYFADAMFNEIKANKQPIGKHSDPVSFTTHSHTFISPVTFYLFSDGYADQFSPDDKKLMTRKFKEILTSIQHLSMEEQGKHLAKFHDEWKGKMEQTDDVLVIGLRV